jgi:hypothetical protein
MVYCSHSFNDRICIFVIWRYGGIHVGIDILVILLGMEYVLCIRIRRPPSIGMYDRLLLFILLVGVCVLLNTRGDLRGFEFLKCNKCWLCRRLCNVFM